MPNYAGLKTEIALPAYTGMTDAQIATALLAPITATVDVPVGTVEGYLRSRMLMGGLQRFVASPPAGAPASLIEGLTELLGMVLSPHVDAVQMTDPTTAAAVSAVLGGCVSAGLMTAANETALMGLAAVTTTRAAQLGFLDSVHDMAQEIPAARIWPGVSA